MLLDLSYVDVDFSYLDPSYAFTNIYLGRHIWKVREPLASSTLQAIDSNFSIFLSSLIFGKDPEEIGGRTA